MSLNLEATKYINDYFKTIVSGYIRYIQSILPYEENAFYIIPKLIQVMILIFYYGEYFTTADDYITIDEDNPNKITYDCHEDKIVISTVYGNIDVADDGKWRKYIWNFKCLELKPDPGEYGAIRIAIDNSREHKSLTSAKQSGKKYYGYESCHSGIGLGNYGCSTTNTKNAVLMEDSDWDSSDGEFETGDQVTMELDTKDRTLMYYKNGNKLGTWIKNVPIDDETRYNMAVTMECGKYCIELTDFKVLEANE